MDEGVIGKLKIDQKKFLGGDDWVVQMMLRRWVEAEADDREGFRWFGGRGAVCHGECYDVDEAEAQEMWDTKASIVDAGDNGHAREATWYLSWQIGVSAGGSKKYIPILVVACVLNAWYFEAQTKYL